MEWLGDIAMRCGVRLPIDSGRVMRMTQSYEVPLERTFALTGEPRIPMELGAAETVKWLNELRG